jgi:NADPH2:quinone reductase
VRAEKLLYIKFDRGKAAVRISITTSTPRAENMTKSIMPITFNALALRAEGAPISLIQKTVSSIEKDEVLIKVDYASINKMDTMLARTNIFNLPAPYVLGFDFSGEVIELGSEGTKKLKPGAKVFGYTYTGGCFAEYVVAKSEHVFLRGEIPAAEASTYGIAHMTAYESIVMTAQAGKFSGKTIYVAGAAGGVGHFAAQLAKIFGLIVIGSAGKASSLQLLREMNLDHVIDYTKQDVVAEVLKITGGKGADLVYDSTYMQSSYDQSTQAVAQGGIFIRLGLDSQLSQTGAKDMTQEVIHRGATMLIADASRYVAEPEKLAESFENAVKWFKDGKLRPYITSTVSFDEVKLQKAFDSFVRGESNVGKMIVKVRT